MIYQWFIGRIPFLKSNLSLKIVSTFFKTSNLQSLLTTMLLTSMSSIVDIYKKFLLAVQCLPKISPTPCNFFNNTNNPNINNAILKILNGRKRPNVLSLKRYLKGLSKNYKYKVFSNFFRISSDTTPKVFLNEYIVCVYDYFSITQKKK